MLNVNVLDSRRPHIPFEEFYNEILSEIIEMDQDFSCYRCKYLNLSIIIILIDDNEKTDLFNFLLQLGSFLSCVIHSF